MVVLVLMQAFKNFIFVVTLEMCTYMSIYHIYCTFRGKPLIEQQANTSSMLEFITRKAGAWNLSTNIK